MAPDRLWLADKSTRSSRGLRTDGVRATVRPGAADHPGGMWPWQRSVAPDERVRLIVPGIGDIPARVVRAVPGAAEVFLGASGDPATPVPPRFLHGRPCHVAPPAHDATDRIEGRLVAVQTWDGSLHPALVHVVFTPARPAPSPATPPPRRPGGVQRRAFHRAPVTAPVTLVPERFRVGWLDGRTRDLSAGGALVTGAERLREGDRLRVLLELGPEELLDTGGRIVRIDGDGLAGLRMDRLGAADRDRLVRYVTLRQREALAALRRR